MARRLVLLPGALALIHPLAACGDDGAGTAAGGGAGGASDTVTTTVQGPGPVAVSSGAGAGEPRHPVRNAHAKTRFAMAAVLLRGVERVTCVALLIALTHDIVAHAASLTG